MGLRAAPGCGDQLDRRRGGLRRAAPAAAAAPAGRVDRGRERAQRRPGDPAGRPPSPAISPTERRTPGGSSSARSPWSWWAGRSIGVLIGYGGAAAAAPGRAAAWPASTRWPLLALCVLGVRRRLAGAHLGVRRGVPVRCGARQRRPAAPLGQHRVRRGHGLPRPDRAVRAARPAGLARDGCSTHWARRCVVGGALLLLARPLSVLLSLVWFRMPWAQQVVRVLGGPARRRPDRPRDLPADLRRAGRDDHLRHRVRAGRRLHPRAGLVAAVGGPAAADRRAGDPPRRRGGVGAAGRAGRRPDAADRARRARACTASTCPSCACPRTPRSC